MKVRKWGPNTEETFPRNMAEETRATEWQLEVILLCCCLVCLFLFVLPLAIFTSAPSVEFFIKYKIMEQSTAW